MLIAMIPNAKRADDQAHAIVFHDDEGLPIASVAIEIQDGRIVTQVHALFDEDRAKSDDDPVEDLACVGAYDATAVEPAEMLAWEIDTASKPDTL